VKIKEIKPEKNFNLLTVFEDGTSGYFDVKPYLQYEAFEQLKNDQMNTAIQQQMVNYAAQNVSTAMSGFSQLANTTGNELIKMGEQVAATQYNGQILSQIKGWLGNYSDGNINYIVMTKGVPLRTSVNSVDSYLMANLAKDINFQNNYWHFAYLCYFNLCNSD
jgi:thymidine phosphorylase